MHRPLLALTAALSSLAFAGNSTAQTPPAPSAPAPAPVSVPAPVSAPAPAPAPVSAPAPARVSAPVSPSSDPLFRPSKPYPNPATLKCWIRRTRQVTLGVARAVPRRDLKEAKRT
jgi:hypothetical protein